MNVILATLAALPDATGLFILGVVMFLAGVLLRRVFLVLEVPIPAGGDQIQPKEQLLK